MAASLDWSCLPEDLLHLTFQKLPVADLLRSSAVCTSWSSNVADLRQLPAYAYRHHHHQAPWLMLLPVNHSGKTEGSASVGKFYCLSEKRFYATPLKNPSLDDRCVFCIGSSHGWLIFADRHSEVCLVNPITGDQIAGLPSVKSLDGVVWRDGTYLLSDHLDREENYPEEKLRFFIYRKAVLSSNPSDGNYTIMLTRPNGAITFARAGDKEWTKVSLNGLYCEDIIFHAGKFYLMSNGGSVHVFDPNHEPSPLQVSVLCNEVVPRDSAGEFKYLVPCPSGDLFLLWQRDAVVYASPFFRVFKTSCFKGNAVEEVKSFGNYSFFVGYHGQSMCLSCKEFPALKPNCIYSPCIRRFQDISIYDLEDGSMQPFGCEGILKPFETPIWFTPSLS